MINAQEARNIAKQNSNYNSVMIRIYNAIEKAGQEGRWDMIIAFPPCTHLAVSGARHFVQKRADGRQRSGIEFFCLFLDADATSEEVDKALSECAYDKPRTKLFVGKAELGDFFAELDKKRKRRELQEKIERRFKEAEKEALYRKLAETDPEMKALLSELDSLK